MGAMELPGHLEPAGPDPFIADLPAGLFDPPWTTALPEVPPRGAQTGRTESSETPPTRSRS